MHFQITGDKIKNVSLCPCLHATHAWRPLTGKKFKYTSILPEFTFISALCSLNEPFIQSRSIFAIFHSWTFFTYHNYRKYASIGYSWCPRRSRFFATPFVGIISGPGIIWGPIWGSFAARGSFAGREHLQACTAMSFMKFLRVRLLILRSSVLSKRSQGKDGLVNSLTDRDTFDVWRVI